MRTCHGVLASALIVACSTRAYADDQFEIQVFHVHVNDPGQLSLELHSNYIVSGAARDPPELSAARVLYENLEPSYGLAKGWEVAAHLQLAERSDGPEFGGVKLRTMVVLPTPSCWPVGFAVNFEGGYVPKEIDPGVWGAEVRPIADWRARGFDVDVNPVLAFAGEGPSPGVPRFQPAVAIRYNIDSTIDFGIEYYANLGPITGFDPVARQGQYIFEAVDLVRWKQWRVRVGLGEGLTAGSNPITVTTIVGHNF